MSCQRDFILTVKPVSFVCPGATGKSYAPGKSSNAVTIQIAYIASTNRLAVPGASHLMDLIDFSPGTPVSTGSLTSPDASAWPYGAYYDDATDKIIVPRAHQFGDTPAIDIFTSAGAVSTTNFPAGFVANNYLGFGLMANCPVTSRRIAMLAQSQFNVWLLTLNPSGFAIDQSIDTGNVNLTDIAFSPADNLIWVCDNNKLYAYDVPTLTLQKTVTVWHGFGDPTPFSLCYVPDTQRIWTACFATSPAFIKVIDPVAGAVVDSFNMPLTAFGGQYNYIRYNPKISKVFMAQEQGKNVYFWNPITYALDCTVARAGFGNVEYPAIKASDGTMYVQQWNGSALVHELQPF